jgi:hypothetical protein
VCRLKDSEVDEQGTPSADTGSWSKVPTKLEESRVEQSMGLDRPLRDISSILKAREHKETLRLWGAGISFVTAVSTALWALHHALSHPLTDTRALVTRAVVVASAVAFSGLLLRLADRLSMPISDLLLLEQHRAKQKSGGDADTLETASAIVDKLVSLVKKAGS